MHQRCVVHRDVSLENILVDASGLLKLSDFGVATERVEFLGPAPDRPGKYQYMSPEVCRQRWAVTV